MTYMSLIFLLRHTYFFLVQHSVFQRPRDDEEHLNWDQESLDKSLYFPMPSLPDCAGSDENSTCSLAGDHARWWRGRDWGN